MEIAVSGNRQGVRQYGQPWMLYGIFFVSGGAALIYQVVFGKELTYIFGSMAAATNTVLATYMGGMAIGAWLGGVLAPRLRKPVAAYAICEALIAIYCAVSPLIFRLIQELYVDLAAGSAPEAPALLPLRLILGGTGLLIPTVLMGLTLPLLARFFEQERQAIGFSVGRLYAANTLGAGLGALAGGYLILPSLGVRDTTLLAVAANLLVAYLALRFQKTGSTRLVSDSSAPEELPRPTGDPKQGWAAISILTVGGLVTLALEVDYIHLLAVAAGNSTYAFSLMLFAFLIGLGGGAEAGRWAMRRLEPMYLLALCEFALCVMICLSISRIDQMPRYFAAFGDYQNPPSWALRELFRGIMCCVALLPPAFLIGAIFTVAIECVGRSFPDRPIRMLGFACALNTFGNILGVLLAGFILLPRIGPLLSVKILAVVCLMLGLVAAVIAGGGRQRWFALAFGGSAMLCVALSTWALNYDELTTGANVYFHETHNGRVIDRAESLDGGLTSVNEQHYRGEVLLTLLTNGKFQGNNVMNGEMVAQAGFALVPLLHTYKRHSALVIGYGTGNTSRVLHDAGFEHLDIVDISADVFALANRHLASINDRVSEKERVSAHVTDGRNFLLLSQEKYDLISIEVNSIWFAGTASLYSRDFYRLAGARLADGGMLQQWMQVHHASPLDMLYVVGSLRAEFRYVWLYLVAGQGILVASQSPEAVPSEETVAAIDARAAMKPTIARYGGTAGHLVHNLVLDPDGVDRFLNSQGVPASYFVSDDDNAHLEYSTPKGNVFDGVMSARSNAAMLARFSLPPQTPPTN